MMQWTRRLRQPDRELRGDAWRWVAAACIAAAGAIHLALGPSHVREVPYIGTLFLVDAGVSVWLCARLLRRGDRLAWDASALLCTGAIAALVTSRTLGLPGYREREWEAAAIASLAVESAVLLAWSRRSLWLPAKGGAGMRRAFLAIVVVLAMLTATPGVASHRSPASMSRSRVALVVIRFLPDTITVPAGTTVRWMNFSLLPHNVVEHEGLFNSNPGCVPGATQSCMRRGERFAFTFMTPGTFGYHCAIHEAVGMTGTVTVT